MSSADKDAAGLLRSLEALVRQRYGLDEIGAITYVVDMPNRIRALEAELAALRTRAVPALEWKPVENGFWCVVGSTVLNVQKATGEGDFWRWSIGIQPDEDMIDVIESPWRKPCASPEEAKSACEAAFLRLVGCK